MRGYVARHHLLSSVTGIPDTDNDLTKMQSASNTATISKHPPFRESMVSGVHIYIQ